MAVIDPMPLPAEPLDWQFKGFPAVEPPPTAEAVGDMGWDLFGSGFMTPVMVLRASAVARNVAALRRFIDANGVDLAPHAKTMMAPVLVAAQDEAGTWAMTVANVFQARVLHACGARRILIANEVVDPAAIRWIAQRLAEDADLEIWCFVDSVAGVRQLADGLGAIPGVRPLHVICELGAPSGRAGCRTVDELVGVAEAAHAAPTLRVAGIGGYEGSIGSGRGAQTLDAIGRWVADLRLGAAKLRSDGLIDTEECLITAGGSAYFDVVSDGLTPAPDGVRVVLRSGAYIGHDRGLYQEVSPLASELEPALELHGTVQSRPEPGLAICDFGRRDAPFDSGMPIPFAARRADRIEPCSAVVRRMDDQHAYVDLTDEQELEVGDRLICGISHPCTAFDRWKALPLVDDDYRVTGVVRTFF